MRSNVLKSRYASTVLVLIFGQLLALLLASLLMTQPLIAVGVVYAIGFWCLAWHRPHVALMLIFALAPFQSDIGGGPSSCPLLRFTLV
jgi:hypothetical protein